jgi:hypothetical protein
MPGPRGDVPELRDRNIPQFGQPQFCYLLLIVLVPDGGTLVGTDSQVEIRDQALHDG